jgi:2-hydroxy-3-keto-5-methylthiopentenyl-1-phosphate phosphatase
MTPSACEVYFDFDHTISEIDVLDDLIARFSITEDWQAVEAEWAAGRIGSRECLERQMAQVRVEPAALQAYLDSIRLDPGFLPLVQYLRGRGIEPVILSDSFTFLISAILANHGIEGIAVFANELRQEGDTLQPSFPYAGSICSTQGNCKCSHLFRRNRPPGTQKIYIGDGRSDVCPAGFCEILFAKDRLLLHFSAQHRRCLPFRTLSDVLTQLPPLLP